jgi:hypothetical protein
MFFWSSFASAFLKACSSSGKATVLPEMALDETFANFRKRGGLGITSLTSPVHPSACRRCAGGPSS